MMFCISYIYFLFFIFCSRSNYLPSGACNSYDKNFLQWPTSKVEKTDFVLTFYLPRFLHFFFLFFSLLFLIFYVLPFILLF